jgi:hypothetical protein
MTANVVGIYDQGALTGEALQYAINEARDALESDSTELNELDLTSDDVRNLRFEVEEEAGFDPEAIRLAVEWSADAIAGGAVYEVSRYTAIRVWSAILRRIKKRHGEDAVGEEARVPEENQSGSQPGE